MSDVYLLPRAASRQSHIDAILERIMALPEDKAWRVEISQQHGPRTVSQNSLLWATYTQILERGGEAMRGWSKDDLHSFFLCEHFGEQIITVFGRKRRVPKRRSSKLDKMEFSDFVESIVRFMADQGVILDMPDTESAW